MTRLFAAIVATSLSIVLYGCNSPTASDSTDAQGAPAPTETQGVAPEGDHAEDAHGDEGGMAGMGGVQAQLAKLSTEDAASAREQRVCPVSGEMLGSMGVPIKVDVDGKEVWICCEGCRDPLLENPDDFLAKLNE